ncbi:carbon storage regulator [Cytobacillus sp. Bac17]|uniref:carbon storage regulator n=1 Tax=Cytobacillus sp. Bac17 TaxID=2926008 RepID=UPI002118B169|nr:carbon storage regulator [Cytobacillus sp. Bac17]
MGLVLGRKPGQEVILIGPNNEKIVIGVVKTEDDMLRLNIDAPKDFQILRSELYEHKDVSIKN